MEKQCHFHQNGLGKRIENAIVSQMPNKAKMYPELNWKYQGILFVCVGKWNQSGYLSCSTKHFRNEHIRGTKKRRGFV